MNNITITGNVTRDSEIRSIPSGEQVLSFSVADNAGRDKPAIFWNCQLWGKRATSLQQYLVKGQQVAVSGSVSEREWTDKDQQKRKALELRVNDVALMGSRQSSDAPAPARAAAPAPRAPSGFEEMPDDVPF